MTNLNSLFLSQAYKDCWDDYNRSLKLRSFPRWDYVILTASNEQQAEGFRKQIADRQNFLPRGTKFIAIPDRDGRRVGSGGATLEVLRYLHEQEGSFDSLRVLVIHSGGDSKRVPQYSALGKLFSPVPHELPNGRSSTLFDEFMICMSSVPSRIREGMVLLSGDNPKENRLFGRDLDELEDTLGVRFWEENGQAHTLWSAALYQEADTIREATDAALELYEIVTGGKDFDRSLWTAASHKSLCAGFNEADPDAIIAWNKRMADQLSALL